jgi:P4 family phage/plasmid primase-like protien
MSITNDLKDFFNKIWGDDAGMRIIATRLPGGRFDTVAHNTNAKALKFTESAIRQGKECFAGVHLFNRDRRKAEDAAGCRALYLDIDVKAGKEGYYQSQVDALGAVKGFLDSTGLPEPSIVSSGYGLHLYYFLQDMLSEDRWLQSAKQLESICKIQGLKADNVTSDRARVMRVPGSLNQKDSEHPAPCEILTELKVFQFDALQTILNKSAPFEIPTNDTSINDAFLNGLVTNSEGAQDIARFCMPFLSADRCNDYARWVAVGITLHNVFAGSDEGLGLWEDWSKQDAKYTPDVCSQKWHGFAERSEGDKLSVGSLVHWSLADSEAFEAAWESHKAERRAETLAARSHEIQLTDVGNAQRFVALHGHSMRFDNARRVWYAFNGSQWSEGANAEVTQLAISTVKAMYVEAAKQSDDGRSGLVKHALRSESANRIGAMIKLAESDSSIQCDVSDFDSDPQYLNVKNGVIDLRTGQLLRHSRELMLSTCIPVEYDPTAKCPTFERFLKRIFAGNSSLMDYVQRAVGYSLTGETKEHAFFLCYGEGANGKSTLLETIHGLLGDLAGTIRTEALMQHKFTSHGGHNEDIATLLGKRFASASETESGHQFAEAALKQLTGGDTITASRKYGRSFSFNPMFKLWITANHRPNIGGTDAGIWRRVRLIPFNECIPEKERDINLKNKLQCEFEGVLAWAVRGSVNWYAEGLGHSMEVDRATDMYRNEQDTIANFLSECCEFVNGSTSVPAILYDDYKRWCIDGGFESANRNQFPAELKKRGIEKLPVKQAGSSRMLWHGLRMRSGFDLGVSP